MLGVKIFCVLLMQVSFWAYGVCQDTVFNQVNVKGQRTGFWKRYYRNGKLAYLAEFRAGKPVGRMVRYDEDGVKRAEIIHRSDGHTSEAKLFSPEGRLVGTGNFYDKQKDSLWQYYGTSGQIVAVEHWIRGEKEGEQLTYSDEGKLAERLRWHKGKQHGNQELYYATGALRMRWNMVEDVVDGEVVTLFSSGAKRMAGKYIAGKREGYWTIWDLDGVIVEQIEYKKGIPVNAAEQARRQDSIMQSLFDNAGKIPELTVESGNGEMY